MADQDKIDELLARLRHATGPEADRLMDQIYALWRQSPSGRLSGLRVLFRDSVERLDYYGYDPATLQQLNAGEARVLKTASQIAVPEHHIALVPVVSPLAVDVRGRTRRLCYGDFALVLGAELRRSMLTVHVPARPYWLLDVDYGFGAVGRSAAEAELAIRAAGRSPLTADELAALALHTTVLEHHGLIAAGQIYGRQEGEMTTFFDNLVIRRPTGAKPGDEPRLDCQRCTIGSLRFGTPSCAARLKAEDGLLR